VRTSIEAFQELARLVWHSSWPGFKDCEKMRREYPWIATEYNWLAEGYKKHSYHRDSFADWNVGDYGRANHMEKEMSEFAERFIIERQQEIDDVINGVSDESSRGNH
jgi:hypothetical protein